MGYVMDESYEASIATFLAANLWVGDSEAPYLASLGHIARLLDLKVAARQALPAGLTMEFRMLFSELRKCKPAEEQSDDDDFDEAIANI
ncbi:hypothetical protein [Rhodococcoides fascians]|uniref:hypothetical protein n=1 Tax=Rhodococcoides fascians TaxID=1828 RepID=UPI000B1990BC|nr:hypothetical protein [Rhodococcus fascians]